MDRLLVIGLVPAGAGFVAGIVAAATGAPLAAACAGICAAAAGTSCVWLLADGHRTETSHRHAVHPVAESDVEGPDPIGESPIGESPFDVETGLLDGRFFRVTLDYRLAAARRQLQPLTLLLVALDGDDVDAGYRQDAVTTFAETLRDTLRDSDSAWRLDPTTFAIILESTPEAGGVWAAERLRMSLLRRGGSLMRMAAAVASYPSHALEADEVRVRAERALTQARASRSSHVEVATAE